MIEVDEVLTAVRVPWRLHPALLFTAAWAATACLYQMRYSTLLVFPSWVIWRTTLMLVAGFAGAALAVTMLPLRLRRQQADARRSWRRHWILLAVWLALSIYEILHSGGVPLLWLLQRVHKTYADFGLPTLHGFDDSLLEALCVGSAYLYLRLRKRVYLMVPAITFVWAVMIVNRNMIIVCVIEITILALMQWRLGLRKVLWLGLGALLLVWAFGVIGDLRSGAAAFLAVASPSPDYPRWLPSGFLWVYVYLTTPINNLMFNIHFVRPAGDWFMSSTMALLFPSTIRDLIYSRASLATSGALFTQAFNVSTAFTSPYSDLGAVGMVLFALGTGIWCSWYWRRQGPVQALSYSVLAQCAILSIFFNHFLYLPVVFQLVWFHLLFPSPSHRSSSQATCVAIV